MLEGASHHRRLTLFAACALLCALVAPNISPAQLPVVDPSVPAARDTEPVILTGLDFPAWSARSNQTAKLPLTDLTECQTFDEQCQHNHYSEPEADTGAGLGHGTPTERLLGYRWSAEGGWQQIPFQVDEQFTRYLANPASGFSFYSGEDEHTTYAYDREGFRWTESDEGSCLAKPASPPAHDPVHGLDDNDELAFMASDAGAAAPPTEPLPPGVEAARAVELRDPLNPAAGSSYVYVMKAAENGPEPAFDAGNGYVSYKRDADADLFEYSESTYDGYGNAEKGVHCDREGNIVMDPATGEPLLDKRRPRDWATVSTDRYRFRYDGRWLMTRLEISGDGGETYGPDLIDRWKARAFQQDPGSETPCCGFEEEDTNWGGSSTLLGERMGPVRAIRETWGADSGTNVIRRETFYRDEMRMKTWLRVHVIPPLDGIYAQWDFNAARMTRFYNAHTPEEGVAVDGKNDEVFGNFDDPCNDNYDQNDTSDFDQGYRSAYEQFGLCNLPYHQSIDIADPTLSGANAALSWSETAGPEGTVVDRYSAGVREVTPAGTPQSVVAVPYYRDDSCFDDGTGSDPGPKLNLRSGDEPRTWSGGERECWEPEDGVPDGSERFFQGSIATHGLHLLFVAESDNVRLTKPISEIVSEQRMVMLPGDPGNVGEQYGRGFEKPLLALMRDHGGGSADGDTSGNGTSGDGGGSNGGNGSSGEGAGGSEGDQRDDSAPRVRLHVTPRKARRPRHARLKLRWDAEDLGGSGIASFTVLAYPHGSARRSKSVQLSGERRRLTLRIRRGQRYLVRLRATDGAGNAGPWDSERIRVRFRRPAR